ncbi:MAG: hypothetical protein FJ403_18510 [Verrucomicrobia bacterium]|nr:hypothetical protein [Verrucomicrobiota bacterium]
MIQLHEDYILFETSTGESIPCSAELVAVGLIGKDGSSEDLELVKQAAAAVLHYFKHDLGRNSVSLADFSMALGGILAEFGVKLKDDAPEDRDMIEVYDLRELAQLSGKSFELAFFPHLRDELRKRLSGAPPVLQFNGLRPCVKQLLGAKRWSTRCQDLNDQIVDYLRQCLTLEDRPSSCGVIVK